MQLARKQVTIARFFASIATIPKEKVPVADGDRVLLKEDAATGTSLKEPILVVRVAGSFYAIEGTCPHMNKSLEKGKIIPGEGDPVIRCLIHNSRFNLTTGVCTHWVTGVLGYDNQLVSSVAQKVGGERRDLASYRVVQHEDGSLTVEDGA
jgi:nitrite reductase/ring-hydroxylating ferredoxin subunit